MVEDPDESGVERKQDISQIADFYCVNYEAFTLRVMQGQ